MISDDRKALEMALQIDQVVGDFEPAFDVIGVSRLVDQDGIARLHFEQRRESSVGRLALGVARQLVDIAPDPR